MLQAALAVSNFILAHSHNNFTADAVIIRQELEMPAQVLLNLALCLNQKSHAPPITK